MTYYDFPSTRNDFPNLVASEKTKQALIRILNASSSQKGTHIDIVSPLSGQKTKALGDKYPNPNIPLLGLTYLYSKKSDVPCLTRYGMSGTGAFRTGKEEISAMNDALAFLTDETRKGKTWCAMSDAQQEKTESALGILA